MLFTPRSRVLQCLCAVLSSHLYLRCPINLTQLPHRSHTLLAYISLPGITSLRNGAGVGSMQTHWKQAAPSATIAKWLNCSIRFESVLQGITITTTPVSPIRAGARSSDPILQTHAHDVEWKTTLGFTVLLRRSLRLSIFSMPATVGLSNSCSFPASGFLLFPCTSSPANAVHAFSSDCDGA